MPLGAALLAVERQVASRANHSFAFETVPRKGGRVASGEARSNREKSSKKSSRSSCSLEQRLLLRARTDGDGTPPQPLAGVEASVGNLLVDTQHHICSSLPCSTAQTTLGYPWVASWPADAATSHPRGIVCLRTGLQHLHRGQGPFGKFHRNPEQVNRLALLYRRLLDELAQLAANAKITLSNSPIMTSGFTLCAWKNSTETRVKSSRSCRRTQGSSTIRSTASAEL